MQPHANPQTLIAPPRASVAVAALAAAACLLLPDAAHAAGSGMPWEGPLTQILESIEGPVARIIAVIVIIITGLSIAFAATSFFLAFFSFGGGAVIA